MRTLHGIAASAGVAGGPVVVVRPAPVIAGGRIDPSRAAAEIDRLEAAMDAAAAELTALAARLAHDHPDEAGIFDAHALFARDEALLEMASARIGEGEDAIAAVRASMAEFATLLRDSGDELLAARAADLDDVATRIVGHLAGVRTGPPDIAEPSIVAAPDLPPSVTASIPHDRLLGILLSEGSKTAHAAILARAYGIPAVVGVGGLLEALEAEAPAVVLFDGSTGEVVLDPDAEATARFETARAAAAAAAAQALDEAHLPVVTRDGIEVTLLANVGGPAEAARAVALGARGVGLFRTEFLFVERSVPRPRTSRSRPTGPWWTRSRRTRSRSGCSTSAGTSRSRTCRSRRRRTRSWASARSGSPGPSRTCSCASCARRCGRPRGRRPGRSA